MTKPVLYLTAGACLVAGGLSVSCNTKAASTAAAPAMPPAQVAVLEVQPHNVPIYSEYSAQTFARDMVEVRGRVDGYIQKRLFEVGSDVQAGQVLYELDLRPYQADVQKAKGDVAQSEANLGIREESGWLAAGAGGSRAGARRIWRKPSRTSSAWSRW